MFVFYNSGLGAGKVTRIRRTRRWRRNRSCKNDWGRQGRGIHVQRPSIRTYMRPPLGGHNSIDKCYTNARKICWERGTWWQYNRIIMWFFPKRWKTYTSNTIKYWISETHAQCVHMLTEWHYQRNNRQQLMLGDSSCLPGAWGIQLRLFGISPTRPSHYLI